ncbi:MAG: serine/threonine-protein phosphatase [Phycisphaeraceae bacterium]|nr:MAG: serine/threonine-protein phosphatase [Phycisphaeraceae bacterium]
MHYRRVDNSAYPEIDELNTLFRVGSTIERPSLMLQHFGAWFGRNRPTDLFISVARRDLPGNQYKVTRLLSRLERERVGEGEPANPWRDWESLPIYEGGLIGEVIARDEPQLLLDLDAGDDPHFGEHLAGMKKMMAIPQYHEGKALNWALSFYADDAGPQPDDLAGALMDTSLLGMATRNLVSKRQAEQLNRALTSQFEQIANIQRSLLPQKLPAIPGLDIATSYLTSDRAGGDYYDFFPFPDGTWGILIADVSGHGPAAATVMAMLRAILHCYADDDRSPASVMRFANDKLVASNLDGSFVTAFFAVYDPSDGTLVWSRCGHNPPLLKRPASGGVTSLETAGVPPLGILPGMQPEQDRIQLAPDETVVLYTDGITEAFDDVGVMFGVDGLTDALETCSGHPDCVVDTIHAALYRHTGVMERDDDQTLVALQRRPDEGTNA